MSLNPVFFKTDFPSARFSAAAETGTVDDEDNRGDEQEDENEIPVGETQDSVEAPEEFEKDDEDTVDEDEDDEDEDEDDDEDLDDEEAAGEED